MIGNKRTVPMNKRLIPQELLCKILKCIPETGELFWRERTSDLFSNSARANCWNSRWPGKPALATIDGVTGYKHGDIFYRKHYAHRVVWAMETGAWPVDHIDHINHDRADNRIANLREVTRVENGKNLSISKLNTSGVTGVCWCKTSQKWHARIVVEKRKIHLGYFDAKKDAINARAAANIKYKFHENHGRKNNGRST